MKILMIVPFYYKWGTYSNVRSHFEYLHSKYEVHLCTRKESVNFDLGIYDIIMLHGSGAILSKKQLKTVNGRIFGFGWSDPNLFNEEHFNQSDVYFTNDLNLSKLLAKDEGKPVHYYQTSCNKRYHVNLNLEKTTDVLVYGQGNHKFVKNRNQIVNELRRIGFKIKVFGREWDKHEDTHGFIEGKDLIHEINSAHVLLDLSNKTTAWPHRIFEASACGTPVITIYREDTALMLEENKEIVSYENEAELALFLSMMLKNKVATRDMGLCAQKRCYKNHDISVRIQRLIDIIEEQS